MVIDVSNAQAAKGLNLAKLQKILKRVKGLRGAPGSKGYRLVVDAKLKLKPNAFTLKPIAPMAIVW